MKNTFLVLFLLVSGISFSQENFELPKTPNEPDKDSVYTSGVESHAEFPGGRFEMMKFINQNMHYPERAVKKNLQGKCYLRFVIDKEGIIRDVKVSRGVPNCPECDEEATRLIKLMPKWIPASIENKPVISYFDLPINFKLN